MESVISFLATAVFFFSFSFLLLDGFLLFFFFLELDEIGELSSGMVGSCL